MARLTCAANGNWTTMGSALSEAKTFQCLGTEVEVTDETPTTLASDYGIGKVLYHGWEHTFPAGKTISYRSNAGDAPLTYVAAG